MANDPNPAAPLAGKYRDHRIQLELRPSTEGGYGGTITAGELRLPVTARVEGTGLAGSFESNGMRFEFRASPTPAGLDLTTDGERYELKREVAAVNPLGKGAAAATGTAAPPPVLQPGGATNPPPLPGTNVVATGTGKSGTKDPLAYRVLEFQGGSVAKFDHWTYTPVMSYGGIAYCDAFPEGRQTDFVMRAAVSTPNSQDLANLFSAGPQLVQQVLMQFFGPVFRSSGEPKKTKCGGDDAMVENYDGNVGGRRMMCRAMYVKRKDIAIAVMAIGTDKGFEEFGRALEIVAQSIHFKESALEPGLLGSWVLENFASATSGGNTSLERLNVAQSRSITFFPNGSFSDTAQTGFSGPDATGLASGGSRGSVVKRGNLLTFRYDDGRVWSAAYELFSNGLKLDGKIYLRQ